MAQYFQDPVQIRNDKSLCLRNLTGKDANAYYEFVKQIPTESTNTMLYIGQEYPTLERYEQQFENDINHRTNLKLGAFDGQKMVAFLSFICERPDHPWARHIGYFATMILKDFWGQGLGKIFLNILDEHANSVGISKIEATVRENNERAIKLYLGCGYQIEGTRKNATLINGQYINELYIAKFQSSKDILF